MAERLATERGVLCLPGSYFGPGQDGHLRVAFANNCRLLIAEPAHFGFRVVDAFSRIVRLGEGSGRGNSLSDGRHRAHPRGAAHLPGQDGGKDVARARLVATEACRLAENGPAFIDRVRDELDLELEVVDRRTEAYLAVTGCASSPIPRRNR